MKNCARRSQPFISLLATVLTFFLTSNSFGICYLTERNNQLQLSAVINRLKDVRANPSDFQPSKGEPSTLPFGGPDVGVFGKIIPRYISDTSEDKILKLNRNKKIFIVAKKSDSNTINGCFNPGNGIALIDTKNVSPKENRIGFIYQVISKHSSQKLDPKQSTDYPSLCIYNFESGSRINGKNIKNQSLICYMD